MLLVSLAFNFAFRILNTAKMFTVIDRAWALHMLLILAPEMFFFGFFLGLYRSHSETKNLLERNGHYMDCEVAQLKTLLPLQLEIFTHKVSMGKAAREHNANLNILLLACCLQVLSRLFKLSVGCNGCRSQHNAPIILTL